MLPKYKPGDNTANGCRIISRAGTLVSGASYHATWFVLCRCGIGIFEATTASLRRGQISCGCARHLGFGESSRNSLFLNYKTGARIRGFSWELSKAEFCALTMQVCHYCGAAPTRTHKSGPRSHGACLYNGVDRKNSDKGYTRDNVVPACWECNRAKGATPYLHFLEWVQRLANRYHSKCYQRTIE
jgi:hypothetical protein